MMHSESPVTVDAVQWRAVMPWLRLFRAFWLAIDLRMLLIAAMGLSVLAVGEWAFSYLPFAPGEGGLAGADASSSGTSFRWPWDEPLGYDTAIRRFPPDAAPFVENPAGAVWDAASNVPLILRPLRSLLEPAGTLLGNRSWSEAAYAWTRLLWALVVWSVFGGALARLAAVRFAVDRHIGLRGALTFSGTRFLSYLSAPLLPIAGFGFLWVSCMIGGLIGRIPVVGEIIVGLLWWIPLLFGFLMTIVVLWVVVGWPLMVTAVSTEGTDGFDGLSRSFSCVFGWPWHYLWYAIVAVVLGSITSLFVYGVSLWLAYLAGWSVASGLGFSRMADLYVLAPKIFPLTDDFGVATGTTSVGAVMVAIWLHGIALLAVAYVASYFWTATTIVYFLLRRHDDGTELDQVFLPEEAEDSLHAPSALSESASAPESASATGATDQQTEPSSTQEQPTAAESQQDPPDQPSPSNDDGDSQKPPPETDSG